MLVGKYIAIRDMRNITSAKHYHAFLHYTLSNSILLLNDKNCLEWFDKSNFSFIKEVDVTLQIKEQ